MPKKAKMLLYKPSGIIYWRNVIYWILVFVVKNCHFDREELAKWMKLTLVRGLGPKRLLQLFNHLESMDELFEAPAEKLLKTGVLTAEMLKNLEQLKLASDCNYLNTIDFCREQDIKIVPLVSEQYPRRLFGSASPPRTLFLWGATALLDAKKTFAIVGSRKTNEFAHKFAYDSAKTLAGAGFVIVSGGAEGIDTDAHNGALDANGATISVLGTGFSNFYPEGNKPLFEKIKKKGLLVSEHLPNFPGNRISFLQRNRITSGLSDGLLFCASENLKSGTATQVKIAYTQKIPIFCPSADLNALPNIGVQEAISEYGATPVHKASEIIEKLNNKKIVHYASLAN